MRLLLALFLRRIGKSSEKRCKRMRIAYISCGQIDHCSLSNHNMRNKKKIVMEKRAKVPKGLGLGNLMPL